MLDFLKTMGQGILYTLLSPFILILVLVYAVYCLFALFFMFFKRIVMFFKGEDMSEEMKIDRAAKMHLNNQDEEIEKKLEEQTPIITQTNIVKEEKTTIVQPIIIQTDEEGRLKNIQYISPTPAPQIEENNPIQIEEQKDVVENIERKEDEE